MSRAQEIRDTVGAGPLPFKQLHLKLGGDDKKLFDLCSYLRGRGELKIGADEDRTVSLTGRRAPPRKGKKPTGKRGGKVVKKSARKAARRPYKRLLDKTLARKQNDTPLRDLALDNYLGAGALLRQAIEDGVEDIEQNFALNNAVKNHANAEKILSATRAA